MVLLFILSLMVINSVSAIDFTITYPETVGQNTEFTFSISSEESGTYDVKAFVHDDIKSSSEIYYNEEWKSPYYYLTSAFPEQESFKLISHYSGDTQICVRLRETGKSVFSQVCEDITIEPESNTNTEEEEESEEPEDEEEPEEEEQPQNNHALIPKTDNQEKEETEEPIILSSKSNPEDSSDRIFLTKQEKTRIYAIIAFTFFCIILIILLALRKL